MLTELCAELRNYFVRDPGRDIVYGDYEISGGAISPLSLSENQYFRIVGSLYNDGVWQAGNTSALKDESFTGAIWMMAVPPAIVDLDADITAWLTKNGDAADSPYQSESFGGYTYSLKSGQAYGGRSASSWQGAFADRLAPYRRRAAVV